MGANTKILIAAGSVSLTGSLVFAFLIAPDIRKEAFEMDHALFSSMSSNKDKLPIFVLAVSGEVYYVPEGSTEKILLTENSVIMEGSTIITSEGASVTIENPDYFTATIAEGTILSITRAKVSGAKPVIELNLVEGTISIISRVTDEQFTVKAKEDLIIVDKGTSLISLKGGILEVTGEASVGGIKAARKVLKKQEGKRTIEDRRPEEEQLFEELESASIAAMSRKKGETDRITDASEDVRVIFKLIKKVEGLLNDGKIAAVLKFVEEPFYLNDEKMNHAVIVEYYNRFVAAHQKYLISIMDDTISTIVKEDGTATSTMLGTFEAEEYDQAGQVTCIIKKKLKITVKLRKTRGLWISNRLNLVYE